MTHAALKDLMENWRTRAAAARTLAERIEGGHEGLDSSERPILAQKYLDAARENDDRADELAAAISAMEGEAVAWSIEQRNGLSRGGVFRDKQEAIDCGVYDPEIDVVRPLIYGDTAPPPQQAGQTRGGVAAEIAAADRAVSAIEYKTDRDRANAIAMFRQGWRCALATHPTPSPGPQGGGEAIDLSHEDVHHGLHKLLVNRRHALSPLDIARVERAIEAVTPPAHQPGEVAKAVKNPRHPIQPLVIADDGLLRFKQNAIVRFLLDHGGIDMNTLAALDFPRADREQFAQLIGYSHRGAETLDYISNYTWETALERYERRTAALAPKEAGHGPA